VREREREGERGSDNKKRETERESVKADQREKE